MQHDEKEDSDFDHAETHPLGVDAWLIAAAHARAQHYQSKHPVALEIADEPEKATQTGYNPYNTTPKKR